jgi:hypothetical protein
MEEEKENISPNIPPKKEEQPSQKEQKQEKEKKTTNQSFWFILFFIAGAKDLLEFIFGLIPVIGSLLVWVVSFFLGGLIIVLIFISGNYKKLKQTQTFLVLIGQFGDLIPVLNILPLSLLTITILYLANKSKKLSSALEKISKTKIIPQIK